MKFDLPYFEKLSNNLEKKEHAFQHVFVSMLERRFPKNRQQELRVLDIGTGVGHLYQNRDWKDFAKVRKITVDAIEPHPFGVRRLKRLAVALQQPINVFALRFEEWRQPRVQKYDFILCSHVFYHFERARWRHIFRNLRSRLGNRGVLTIVAASRDSEVYAWTAQVLGNDRDQNRATKFGDFIFAEDIEEELAGMRMAFDSKSINARVYLIGREGNTSSRSGVANFLSFMYRTSAQRVLDRMDWEQIDKLPTENGRPYVRGIDKVIFIGNR